MTLDEVRIRARIAPLNKVLESRFGLTIEPSSIEHITDINSHYADKRSRLLAEQGEACAIADPNYAKATLIVEATSMILREISPKRMKHRSRRKS